MLTLITGGARSGKSRFAQTLSERYPAVTYVATARVEDDGEMARRVAFHREARPTSWLTIEEPLAVPEVVARCATAGHLVLLDCVTVWLSNLFFELRNRDELQVHRCFREQAGNLVKASQQGKLIAVTNEVGSGIVPDSTVGRQFRDLQGFVNQQLASSAETVYLVVSGIPLQIKPAFGGVQ